MPSNFPMRYTTTVLLQEYLKPVDGFPLSTRYKRNPWTGSTSSNQALYSATSRVQDSCLKLGGPALSSYLHTSE